MDLGTDLAQVCGGVMAEGEPAGPHPEDRTGGLTSPTSSHKDKGAGRLRLVLNDSKL